MILEVFSNLNDSMILFYDSMNWKWPSGGRRQLPVLSKQRVMEVHGEENCLKY